MSSLWRALNRRPLVMHMTVSGIIGAGGDALAQLGIEKRNIREYDVMRTARFVIVNSFLVAPMLHKWFGMLEKYKGWPSLKGWNVVPLPIKRVILDQGLFSWWFQGLIVTSLRVLEGFPLNESLSKTKKEWFGIWWRSLTVFATANLFNFYVVPYPMRVIFIQIVAFFWSTYLSLTTQKKLKE